MAMKREAAAAKKSSWLREGPLRQIVCLGLNELIEKEKEIHKIMRLIVLNMN
jgi:hypothetical protein